MKAHTREKIEKQYQSTLANCAQKVEVVGITEYFVPGAGWTTRCMTGSFSIGDRPMLKPNNNGLFAAFLDGATSVQFCVRATYEGGMVRDFYPDYQMRELAEAF